MKKNFYCLFLFFLYTIYIIAEPTASSKLIKKNYYFLSQIVTSEEAKSLIESDSILVALTRNKFNVLKGKTRINEIADALKFSEDDIALISSQLKLLYKPSNILGHIVKDSLIPSGCYYLYQNLPGEEFLSKVWEQDAHGINYAIDVYGKGMKPNYPLIDSISYDVNGEKFEVLIHLLKDYLIDVYADDKLFFDMPLQSTVKLLDINHRNEAIDYEPLEQSVNLKSYESIKNKDWNKYPYSLILVLGKGPEDHTESLSAEGKLRVAKAVYYYEKGLAPFIVVSGGRVHPYRTIHNEAQEMKNYLMTEYQIPESAIIMDPHARHTTTNIRNCARIMFRQNIPTDKPALISSQTDHIDYVISKNFEDRCMKELNIKPYRLGKRLHHDLVEFYPDQSALQINPKEPLDP